MSKNSPIILPEDIENEQLTKLIIFYGNKLMNDAIKDAQKIRTCKRCGRGDKLKVVPLYEDPTPLPSKIILFCSSCKYNSVLIERSSDARIKYYMSEIQDKINSYKMSVPADDDKVIKDAKLADKLIKPIPKKKK